MDYEIISPIILTFGPSIRSFDITFNIINDNIYERDEEFGVDLSIPPSSPPMLFLGIDELAITIVDDEGKNTYHVA